MNKYDSELLFAYIKTNGVSLVWNPAAFEHLLKPAAVWVSCAVTKGTHYEDVCDVQLSLWAHGVVASHPLRMRKALG